MMDLKERILKILAVKKHSYSELAKYLNVSEADLDRAFADNTIEIRTLELISKELRIPLYSFFREKYEFDFETEKFYTTDIWADSEEENRAMMAAMKKEISRLKAELAEKDALFKRLEAEINQLKKSKN